MRLNFFLLLILAATVGLNWRVRRDASAPNYEYLPEMVHSVAYESFSANPNFTDGKTLQTPPPGTIPRGALPLYYQATPEDAVRAGEELKNPFPPDNQRAVERGARVFNTFCLPCHGTAGKGDGTVTFRGFPPPVSLLAEKAQKMKDGQIFHVITYGQKNMPSYAAQISPDDRWKAVLHVRALQRSAQPAAPAPEAKQP